MTDKERGKNYKELRACEKHLMSVMRSLAHESVKTKEMGKVYADLHKKSAEVLLMVMSIEDTLMAIDEPKRLTERRK